MSDFYVDFYKREVDRRVDSYLLLTGIYTVTDQRARQRPAWRV